MSMQASSPIPVNLPPGVRVVASRETTQQNIGGILQQGMVFTVVLPSGAPTSVFVPYSIIGQPDAVGAAIMDRVNAIRAIEGFSS